MASATKPPLGQYRVLSFDVFGTLVDCDTVIHQHLIPLVKHLPNNDPLCASYPVKPLPGHDLSPPHPLLSAFGAHQSRISAEQPRMRFEDILRESYMAVAADLGVSGGTGRTKEADALAGSIGTWAAFPDTVSAMHRLQKRYKLIALSNVSLTGVRAILSGPLNDVQFDKVYIAEDIGSYKPDRRNFEYLLDGVRKLGFQKEQLLHVAHGVSTDQVSAEEMGIDHVWVERQVEDWGDARKEAMTRLRIVKDLQTLADEVERSSNGE